MLWQLTLPLLGALAVLCYTLITVLRLLLAHHHIAFDNGTLWIEYSESTW